MDITVRLTPDSLRRLENFAAEWGYSRTEAVEVLILYGLNALGGAKASIGTARLSPSVPKYPSGLLSGPMCPVCGGRRLQRHGQYDFKCLDCSEQYERNNPPAP